MCAFRTSGGMASRLSFLLIQCAGVLILAAAAAEHTAAASDAIVNELESVKSALRSGRWQRRGEEVAAADGGEVAVDDEAFIEKLKATGRPDKSEWPLATPPRSDEDVRQRAGWMDDCLQYQPIRPRGQSEPREDAPAISLDRAKLKAHAFHVFARTEHLRNKLPYANHSFNPGGPWIENWWVNTFARPVVRRVKLRELVELRDAANALQIEHNQWTSPTYDGTAGAPLPATVPEDKLDNYVTVREPYDFELFFPLVPLFINYEDISFWTIKRTNKDVGVPVIVGNTLMPIMRLDVTYVTVVQRTMGALFRDWPQFEPLVARTVTLDAGGRTQIPIPLLAREIPVQELNPWQQRKHLISFLGNRRSGTREKCVVATLKFMGNVSFLEANVQDSNVERAQAKWVRLMTSSILQLAPRGTGPTSFRLFEALQMGEIPIYVWEFALWLPYLDYWNPLPENGVDLWRSIAFVVHADDYPQWLKSHMNAIVKDPALLDAMREVILSVRERYFTYEAVMWQIYRLLRDPWKAELRCVPRS
jgi:hypothetical protein